MVNRDRHEIAIEILNRAVSGKKKTEIMRDVGLSYLQAKLYLGELVDRELLRIDEKHNLRVRLTIHLEATSKQVCRQLSRALYTKDKASLKRKTLLSRLPRRSELSL